MEIYNGFLNRTNNELVPKREHKGSIQEEHHANTTPTLGGGGVGSGQIPAETIILFQPVASFNLRHAGHRWPAVRPRSNGWIQTDHCTDKNTINPNVFIILLPICWVHTSAIKNMTNRKGMTQ